MFIVEWKPYVATMCIHEKWFYTIKINFITFALYKINFMDLRYKQNVNPDVL